MRKFHRAAVAAVGLLAFSGIAAQSAQATAYQDSKYASFSACQSSGKNAQSIKKFHCAENGDGSWTLHIDETQPCKAATPNSTAAQASTKSGFSTMGC